MLRREICLLLLLFPVISGFNVGIKGAKILTGNRGSMLGYSLDFATRGNDVWLLVGSPKANDSKAMPTGSMYFCKPAGLRSLGDCSQIDVTRFAPVSPGAGFTEHRTEMWLGSSVDVGMDANAVTFCGPRWMRDSSDSNVRAMNGLCYEVPFGFLEGDSSGLVNPNVLYGLYNSAPSDQFTTADQTKFNQTLKYGVSASGLSIKYHKEEVLVGSPGLNEFAGGVVNVKGATTTVKAEETTEARQGQMYGYAIGVGRFYDVVTYYFAFGGPRDGGSGKVVIKGTDYTVKETLVGKEPGSYFGSVLCVVPGQNNAPDHLLVGAPMYSNMKTYTNYYNSNQEQGRVYVYGKSQTTDKLEVKQTLEGSKARGARFGFAMANLNDFNKDGYNDVVIGAPFESEGQGAVYVYMGYKRGFYLTQTITAASVAPSGTTLSTFGSSFTQHPADFNGDDHADLAVGAYNSDMTFILYTNRPITMIVDTKTNLTLPVGGGKATIIPQNTEGFTLNVCFDYEGNNIPSDVLVTFTVTADTAFRTSSGSNVDRVCFKQSETTCVEKMTGSFTIFKAPAELTCPKSPLQVLIKDDWNKMRGLFVPVVFDVEFTVSTSGSTECTVGCPVVNKFDPNNDDPFAKTRKYSYELARDGCGSDNICQSDVKLMVQASDSIVTGPQAEYMIDITVSNNGEPSYNTEVFFNFHANMTLSETITKNLPISCSPDIGTVQCSLNKQKMARGEIFSFGIKLDSSKVLPLINSFYLSVEVKSDSNDLSTQDNVYRKSVDLITKVDASYNLAANPEVYITKVAPEKPTIEVYHSVQIVNTGPSNLLDTLTFNVKYPQSSQVKPTKIVLNVSSATDDTLIRCENLRLQPEGLTNLTYRAFTIPIDEAGNSKSGTNFDCSGAGTCSRLECDIGTFMYDSFISVDFSFEVVQNLYNIINDQTGNVIPDVPIVTTFLPQTNNPAVNLQGQGGGLVRVVTKILPSKPVEEDVPIWAIVVPIIIAVIILGVIIFVLWKKGFFKRKYKVQMEERKAGKGKPEEEDDFDNLHQATFVTVNDEANDEKPIMSTFVSPPEEEEKEKEKEKEEEEEPSFEINKDMAADPESKEVSEPESSKIGTTDTEKLIPDDSDMSNGLSIPDGQGSTTA
ncbi:integrin alpha-4-like isoform X2 [Saccostrea echinata]|uniref:integrin alpha-4-like isoform X2 n=1 Tax=Saccostrea echinata TaxID=191078 RepID=UPI002A83603C|nr:integrin alpha-4-like isoform X2 [Saccostrea echinata]